MNNKLHGLYIFKLLISRGSVDNVDPWVIHHNCDTLIVRTNGKLTVIKLFADTNAGAYGPIAILKF